MSSGKTDRPGAETAANEPDQAQAAGLDDYVAEAAGGSGLQAGQTAMPPHKEAAGAEAETVIIGAGIAPYPKLSAAGFEAETVIIGAGIAGMVAALALARHNIRSAVYEKTARLQEVGAGIQLAPNATRLLSRLNLLDSLSPYVVEPDFINLDNADSGKTLLHLPVKAMAMQRWGAPYYTIHRADIQKALKQAIDANPYIDFIPDRTAESVSGSANAGFELRFADGSALKTRRLICCDGVRSPLRAAVNGEKAQFSSYIAWRAVLPREMLPADFAARGGLNSVSAYMSRDSHCLIYPLRQGDFYNFVIITKSAENGRGPGQITDKTELLQLFHGRDDLLRRLIELVPNWTFWPLYQMPSPRFLSANGMVLLGDAAHAVTPFAAQGAGQAIEDACAFAEAAAGAGWGRPADAAAADNIRAAFARFDAIRQKRLRAVAMRGDFNRFVYHLSGPMAAARNLVMRIRPQRRFLTDLDWLYGYDATAPFIAR